MTTSDNNFIDFSLESSSESGSNWSQPQRGGRSRTHFFMPKRKLKQHGSKLKISTENRVKQHRSLPDQQRVICTNSRLQLTPYHIRLSPTHTDVATGKALLNRINEETMIVKSLYPLYEQATRQLEAELMKLKQRMHDLESEAMVIKRKRWCRTCLNEATYVQHNRFFCSSECEAKYTQRHNDHGQ